MTAFDIACHFVCGALADLSSVVSDADDVVRTSPGGALSPLLSRSVQNRVLEEEDGDMVGSPVLPGQQKGTPRHQPAGVP